MDKNLRLKTAIWIYDIEDHYIRWANESALDYWHADTVEALNHRDFKQNTSEAVKQGLLEYKARFSLNESFNLIWQFSPLGINKKAFCRFSGVTVNKGTENEKLAMLVEATPLELLSPLIESESTAILASFDKSGELLSCNPPFKSEFGDEITSFQSILSDAESDQGLFDAFSGSKRSEKDIRLRTVKGTKWFQASMTPARLYNGSVNMLVRLQNIDKRKTHELHLSHLARTDALTGLLNRRGLKRAPWVTFRFGTGVSPFLYRFRWL